MLSLLKLVPFAMKLIEFLEKIWDKYQEKKLKAEGRAEAKAEAQAQLKEEIKEHKEIEVVQAEKSDEEVNAVLTKGFKR